MTKEERAVILAAMMRYRRMLRQYHRGNLADWLAAAKDNCPDAIPLIRACARLEKRREHAK